MKLFIVAVGKQKPGPERDLTGHFLQRARQSGRAAGLAGIDEIEIAESQLKDAGQRKRDEANRITERITPGTALIALDEQGQNLTSKAFANRLRAAIEAADDVAFVVGGPDGLDPGIVKSARLTLAMGKMTWPHRLARVMLAEQIYRAVTILTNHPYHRQ